VRLALPAVVVLVGPVAGGKTTARHALVAAGLDPELVVSLDDERLALRQRSENADRPVKALNDYTLVALKICAHRQQRLLAAGTGYLADNTHLRRQERVVHVRAATAAGLRAVALLTAEAPLDELVRRNAARDDVLRVPDEVIARHHHRRSLLTPELLRDADGFAEVYVVDASTAYEVVDPARDG